MGKKGEGRDYLSPTHSCYHSFPSAVHLNGKPDLTVAEILSLLNPIESGLSVSRCGEIDERGLCSLTFLSSAGSVTEFNILGEIIHFHLFLYVKMGIITT